MSVAEGAVGAAVGGEEEEFGEGAAMRGLGWVSGSVRPRTERAGTGREGGEGLWARREALVMALLGASGVQKGAGGCCRVGRWLRRRGGGGEVVELGPEGCLGRLHRRRRGVRRERDSWRWLSWKMGRWGGRDKEARLVSHSGRWAWEIGRGDGVPVPLKD